MRIGLVGGGTGGHFYPLMAVADELNQTESNPVLYYFGPAPYNQEELAKHKIKYVYCPAGKIRRYFSVQNFFDIFRTFFGFFYAIIKLYTIYPDVIFSKGGYTAVPILLAARILMIPVVIHESDTSPGKANKLGAKFAKYIAISYPEAASFFPPDKTALTGIPVRKELKQEYVDARASLGITGNKPLIYITGGSQGAKKINDIILESLDELLPHYQIFHQTGTNNIEEMRQTAKGLLRDTGFGSHYYMEGSIPATTVNLLFQASDLVITRAGSTTLFETAFYGKPAIVIPISEDVSRDQRTNAYAYARSGAATVIEEKNLNSNLLAQEIHSIIDSPERHAEMSAAAKKFFILGAASKLSTVLISIGNKHGS